MAHQIIKQPNGLYCVWSTVTDSIIVYDATIDDLIEDAVKEYRERITEGYRKTTAELDAGKKPYAQFTKSFKEAIAFSKRVHRGDKEFMDELAEIIKAVNSPAAQPAERE